MSRRSRLWRKLGLTQPLMRVWSEDDSILDLDDHRIKSIKISRGDQSSSYGDQQHTLTVETTAALGVRNGMALHCDLSSYGADFVGGLVDATPGTIRERYFGRIGKQAIEDRGGYDGSKWHATMYAASWQAQLHNTTALATQPQYEPINTHMGIAAYPLYVGLTHLPRPQFPAPYQQYGSMAEHGDPITYPDSLRKYITEAGTYVQNTRAGVDRYLPMEYRWTTALDRLDTQAPLTRSQAISPATWDQPQENLASNHRVKWIDPSGMRTHTRGPNPADEWNTPLTEYDLTHIYWTNNFQPMHLADAAYNRENNTGYSIPSLTIDMLRLITSPVPYHRAQARQLLQLNMGDPVYLSGDWNPYLRGIHFANGIEESITPDGWEITLSLTPSHEVVGEFSPEVPARIWESWRIPWQDASGQWQSA